jgi:hypothetical protein
MIRARMMEHKNDLYYLFPGQGGRARRQRFIKHMVVAVVVGLIVSGILAGVIYAMQA